MKWRVNPRIGSLAVMCVLAASFTWLNAQQRSGAAVAIDAYRSGRSAVRGRARSGPQVDSRAGQDTGDE